MEIWYKKDVYSVDGFSLRSWVFDDDKVFAGTDQWRFPELGSEIDA